MSTKKDKVGENDIHPRNVVMMIMQNCSFFVALVQLFSEYHKSLISVCIITTGCKKYRNT